LAAYYVVENMLEELSTSFDSVAEVEAAAISRATSLVPTALER
jgi:hypothetical protein